jgi:hypothetical protein
MKTNTVVKFNIDAITTILGTQTEGIEKFTFEETVDAQKFCGFDITIPVETKDGIEVSKTISLSKQEVDNLLLEAAKTAAKLSGVSSSSINYSFRDAPKSSMVVESVTVILNSITR